MLLTDNTARLTSAISSLPELLERKNIGKHTNMDTALLDEIKVIITISKFVMFYDRTSLS